MAKEKKLPKPTITRGISYFDFPATKYSKKFNKLNKILGIQTFNRKTNTIIK